MNSSLMIFVSLGRRVDRQFRYSLVPCTFDYLYMYGFTCSCSPRYCHLNNDVVNSVQELCRFPFTKYDGFVFREAVQGERPRCVALLWRKAAGLSSQSEALVNVLSLSMPCCAGLHAADSYCHHPDLPAKCCSKAVTFSSSATVWGQNPDISKAGSLELHPWSPTLMIPHGPECTRNGAHLAYGAASTLSLFKTTLLLAQKTHDGLEGRITKLEARSRKLLRSLL